jgi:hypothetical protein
MRNRLGVLAAVVLCLLALCAPAEAARGKKYAFLVACSEYQAGQFRKLPGTVAEMKEFRQTLLGCGFRAEDVVFLHDGAGRRYLAEKQKIIKELDLLLGRLEKGDSVVLALNGHGLHFKGEKAGYFVPLDGEVEKKDSLVAMEGKGGLFEQLKQCKAGRKLLLVNACRNDPLDDRAFAARKVKIDDEDKIRVSQGQPARQARPQPVLPPRHRGLAGQVLRRQAGQPGAPLPRGAPASGGRCGGPVRGAAGAAGAARVQR